MTFEEWMESIGMAEMTDKHVVHLMRKSFNAGADSVKEIRRRAARNYYAALVEQNICVRCKRKHDGKRTQCPECILAIKQAKGR